MRLPWKLNTRMSQQMDHTCSPATSVRDSKSMHSLSLMLRSTNRHTTAWEKPAACTEPVQTHSRPVSNNQKPVYAIRHTEK